MSNLSRALSVFLLLATPMIARGDGFYSRYRNSVACYCPVVVTCVPVSVYDPCAPYAATPGRSQAAISRPVPGGKNYAPPTAAPPSATPSTTPSTLPPPLAEPPPPKLPPLSTSKPPQVSEPRYYYDSYAATPRTGAKPLGDRVSVGFWNLTDQDVTIKIDGQPRLLPKGKSVSMELGREFIWHLEGRDPQTERVATGESAMEIVIRKGKE